MWSWDILNLQHFSLCFCSWTSFCWENRGSTACLNLYFCVYVSVFLPLSTWLPVATSLCSSPEQEGIWRLWQPWFLNNKLMTKSQSYILSSHTLLSFVDSSAAYTPDGTENITSTLLRQESRCDWKPQKGWQVKTQNNCPEYSALKNKLLMQIQIS